MTDLIKLGYSGTSVHQNALNVTGHNIANVDTPGYSRQEATQSTLPPYSTGEGYFGTGVRTDTIRRITESFLTEQVRNDTSMAKEYETVLSYAKQLDNLLADPSSSPGAVLNQFFAAMESLNDEPDSQPLRELVLSEAQTLVNRFNLVNDRYESINESLNTQMSTAVLDINRISSAIAGLNKEIAASSGRTGGMPPNDLMDMRDEKLRELSELVQVKTTNVADGTISVFIGDGFPVVINEDSFSLKAGPGRNNQFETDIYYQDPKEGDKLITDLINGGELGGILNFRHEVMNPAMNELGRLAITISDTFNDQHKKGMNLNNQIGGDFFTDVNEYALTTQRITAFQDNNPSGALDLEIVITDPAKLSTKDYRLKALSGGPQATFSLTDTDGNTVRFTDNSTSPATNKSVVTLDELKSGDLEVDGFTFYMDTGASTVFKGDQFTISPTRTGAQNIRREITSGDEIAIASPMRATEASYNDGSLEVLDYKVNETFRSAIVTPPGFDPNGPDTPTNPSIYFDQRDGSLKAYLPDNDADGVDEIVDLPDGVKVVFDPDGNYTPGDSTMEYKIIIPNSSYTTPAADYAFSTQSFTLGQTQNVIPDDWGFTMDLGGIPEAGDAVLIDFNTDGFGDNTNGVAISDLQSKGVMEDGKVTYQDSYSHIAQFVGVRTAEAKVNAESGYAILDQSVALRDGVSGVNLDEEAANLVKFQQAYNASAQLIAISQQLFSSLINAVGR